MSSQAKNPMHKILSPSLFALNPLDGRYENDVKDLRAYFSEAAFILYRIRVELHWFLHTSKVLDGVLSYPTKISQESEKNLLRWMDSLVMSSDIIQDVKVREAETQHDVKAIEYALADHLKKIGYAENHLSLLHFGCTSEDINNLAYSLMLRDALTKVVKPNLKKFLQKLAQKASDYAAVPMLGRTHGQAATPTSVGKELAIFAHRWSQIYRRLDVLKLLGKFNGSVGNYNALTFCFPQINWEKEGQNFVEKTLGLTWNPLTTQIESHDAVVELSAILAHSSALGIAFCRDMWSYISLGYFKQDRGSDQEIGSSVMPHKINPKDFENAEANFGLCSALAQHFQSKLPISRWQRDLSDSSTLRNLGLMFGYCELAMMSMGKGFARLALNESRLNEDLEASWEVLAEPLQTLLRSYGDVHAYEKLKSLSRGKKFDKSAFDSLIALLPIQEADKVRLQALSPLTYLGLAPSLARTCLQELENL